MARFSRGSDWRRLFWMGSLILLSVAFSLGFSCAVPLAPFATIGALTVLIGAVWLANQMTGFALLHYPLERTAFAWAWFSALSRFLPRLPHNGSTAAFRGGIAS
ncbi:MAG TPA: hypothetical protein VNY06_04850 [Methylocella sp.]|nr:hypothetical protein [Methylocella sp.]